MIVHFMVTISTSLVELLQNKFLVDFDQNLENNKSLLSDYILDYSKAVDEIISLLSKALK